MEQVFLTHNQTKPMNNSQKNHKQRHPIKQTKPTMTKKTNNPNKFLKKKIHLFNNTAAPHSHYSHKPAAAAASSQQQTVAALAAAHNQN